MNLNEYFLCGIGVNNTIHKYDVGYSIDGRWFSFPNGSFANSELTLEPVGGNSYYIISHVSLSKLDDLELLGYE